jgi:Domain of unknown function (DUF5916)
VRLAGLPALLVCTSALLASAASASAGQGTGGAPEPTGMTGQETPTAAERKRASATRVENGTIRVDGHLDEAVWVRTVPISDFIQKEPVQGAAPTDDMEVRFAYDGGAFYVGARMWARKSPVIQAPLGRRDVSDQAEHIQIAFDTFLDRRTSIVLGVTASGVRLDRYHATDAEDTYDTGYDPVWVARTSIDAEGWSVEMWIPFTQLRFNPIEALTWGLNIQRFRPSINEEDTWVLIPRTVRAWSSRFGDLHGISDVRPARRIELLPYAAETATLYGSSAGSNPFLQGPNLTTRVGADVKIGIGPNLTLDATVNPDFGQVEADPAEVNLTAFETRFTERRPFFLEGSSLFNIGHPNFYYSRRIGARAIGPAQDDFVDYPSATTILGAAKLTGRLPSKTSLGFLAAATSSETADLADAEFGAERSIRVAPRAYWGVARVLQEFGRNASTAGAFASWVHRDFAHDDPLAALYSRNALALAGNTLLRFKGGQYEFRAEGGGSLVNGSERAIERVQRSSAHFAQRPDREYAPLDPTLTSLPGWTFQSSFNRISGRHWLWGANTKIDSVNFETNDFAQLTGADGLLMAGNIRYRETQPGRLFRNYYVQFDVSNDATLRMLRQDGRLRGTVNLTFANFWTAQVQVARVPELTSISLTRGGPLMQRGPGWNTQINVGNRAAAQTRLTATAVLANNDSGLSQARVTGTVSFRPAPRWQLSAEPLYEQVTEPQQYVTTLANGRPETYGFRYVFGFIDRTTVSTRFRMGYTVKPDMNLDVYAEPFAASGHYDDYGELLAPRSRERLLYGTSGTTRVVNADGSQTVTADGSTFTLPNRDFNSLSFRSNVVLRWEWRPGSTLFVVWQQSLSNTAVIGDHVDIRDMFRSVTAPGPNLFVVKTTFWIPVR